jgi:hypothetical protein
MLVTVEMDGGQNTISRVYKTLIFTFLLPTKVVVEGKQNQNGLYEEDKMKLLKRKNVCKLIILVCSFNIFLFNEAVAQEEDGNLLSLVKESSKYILSNITTVKGKVIANKWSFREEDGGIVETKTIYDIATDGRQLKCSVDINYLKSDSIRGLQPPARSPIAGQRIYKELFYDGEKLIIYFPLEKMANIYDPNSGNGFLELFECKNNALIENHGVYDLTQAEREHDELTIIGKEKINGSETIILEIVDYNKGRNKVTITQRLWIDPFKGFAVPRHKVWMDGWIYKNTLVEEISANFRGVQNNIWIPIQWSATSYRINPETKKYYKSEEVNLIFSSDYKINVEIGKNEFLFEFPKGTYVYDRIGKINFKIP